MSIICSFLNVLTPGHSFTNILFSVSVRDLNLNDLFVFHSAFLLLFFCILFIDFQFAPVFFISNQPTYKKTEILSTSVLLNLNLSLFKSFLFAPSEMSFYTRNIKRHFQAHFTWHIICIFGTTLESVGLIISSEVQQISVPTLEICTAVHTGPLSVAFRDQSPRVRVILFEWGPAHLWGGHEDISLIHQTTIFTTTLWHDSHRSTWKIPIQSLLLHRCPGVRL